MHWSLRKVFWYNRTYVLPVGRYTHLHMQCGCFIRLLNKSICCLYSSVSPDTIICFLIELIPWVATHGFQYARCWLEICGIQQQYFRVTKSKDESSMAHGNTETPAVWTHRLPPQGKHCKLKECSLFKVKKATRGTQASLFLTWNECSTMNDTLPCHSNKIPINSGS